MKLFFTIITIVLFALSLSACARKDLRNHQSTTDSVKTTSPPERALAADSAGVPMHPSAPQSRVGESKLATADTVVGEVYVAGNEPFTRVMLSIASSKSIDLEGDSAVLKELRGMQGERIIVVGTTKISVMGAAIIIKEFYRVKEKGE
jgi:type IV pilus biogenesis protein CpaD/CtpE